MYLNIAHKGIVRKIISQAAIISPHGESITVPAMWDTGATISMISEDVAKKLQLEHVGFTDYTHAAGVATSHVYMAAIELQGGLRINRIGLASLPDVHSFSMIIGMNIISRGDLSLKNSTGNTVFTFKC